tara:strand:+ start:159 stop:563 length:405 start_codon:yes stop_codon:yes gene_type:complete
MSEQNYQVIKLANGENLICDVISDSDTTMLVRSPLKMETLSKITKSGVIESLSLVRWMQPFCDEKKFTLSKSTVILNSPVSIGLGKYYEFILKKMDGLDIPQPSEKELKAIEEEESQELKDQMLEYIKDDVTIH